MAWKQHTSVNQTHTAHHPHTAFLRQTCVISIVMSSFTTERTTGWFLLSTVVWVALAAKRCIQTLNLIHTDCLPAPASRQKPWKQLVCVRHQLNMCTVPDTKLKGIKIPARWSAGWQSQTAYQAFHLHYLKCLWQNMPEYQIFVILWRSQSVRKTVRRTQNKANEGRQEQTSIKKSTV